MGLGNVLFTSVSSVLERYPLLITYLLDLMEFCGVFYNKGKHKNHLLLHFYWKETLKKKNTNGFYSLNILTAPWEEGDSDSRTLSSLFDLTHGISFSLSSLSPCQPNSSH